MKISFKLFRNPDLDFYLHYLEILMWFLSILKFLFININYFDFIYEFIISFTHKI